MKKLTLAAIVVLVLILSACLAATTKPGDAPAVTSSAAQTTVAAPATETDTTSAEAAPDAAAAPDTATTAVTTADLSAAITLAGDTVTVDGSGVTVDGTIVTVTAPGVYQFSGTLDNGQLAVDSDADGDVVLLLAGVDITSADSAPINVRNADNTIITLVDGSENRLTDAAEYVYPDAETDEPDGALFSDDDLTINGGGTLIVTANYNHGIVGKDDLVIDLTPGSGTLIVSAVNDGIKGRDSLLVQGGALTIDAGGDGMQSN
ncbi:MAG: carbohydrate-binding domain-containing protein, partial [Caldilineaceae bacterium]|nr:carbohydrate-binding domain-containing protein [Caldilineaceae bacterium]